MNFEEIVKLSPEISNVFDYEVFENVIELLDKDEVHILEIGSWKGASAVAWAEICLKKGIKYSIECLDCWDNQPQTTANFVWKMFEEEKGQNKINYECFLKNTKDYNISHKKIPYSYPVFWNEHRASRETYDIVYYDAAHDKNSTFNSLIYWSPKAKYMVVDDYFQDFDNLNIWQKECTIGINLAAEYLGKTIVKQSETNKVIYWKC